MLLLLLLLLLLQDQGSGYRAQGCWPPFLKIWCQEMWSVWLRDVCMRMNVAIAQTQRRQLLGRGSLM